MKAPAAHPALARLLRSLGVDPVQYSLLLDLFSKLSDRQEFEIGNARLSWRVAVGVYAAISGLVNLLAGLSGRPPIQAYVSFNFLFVLFLLIMILATEAVNTFINPVEASVLAHQPVREKSYIAAKLTYLNTIVTWVVFPLSVVPSLAGLNLGGARWFYTATYMAAVYLLGLFVALVGCGILGLLFRVVPAARIRSAALWLQMGFFLFIFIGPRLARGVRALAETLGLASIDLSAIPLTWFVSLALAGHPNAPAVISWPAFLSMILSAVLIGYGIRSLSEGYLTRVHMLLRSGPARGRVRRSWFGAAVRALTGRPSGRAAFSFIYGMARTDWQFRRTVYPLLIQFLFLPLFGMLSGPASPFAPGAPSPAHFLPHIPGLIGLMVCAMITYSDQHRAAWIFLTAPLDGIQSFVRGIFWSLWIPLSAIPLLLMPLLAWRWGVADALLFAAYSVAIGSFYLSLELFLTEGLPFANPPKAGKASMAAPMVIGTLVAALILVGLQWLFIFQSRLVAVGATLAFAGAAYAIAQTSLRYLEVNVMHHLHLIASGRTAMFKELE